MERFLSESRKGLPDIDLDVESARRIEAYRAIVDAYSEQRVACVSMMETYRARSAIRDVAAALGLPPHEIDAVAKAFPHIRAGRIRSALTELPELRGQRAGHAPARPPCSSSPNGSTGCPGTWPCTRAAWCCPTPPCWTGPRWSRASRGCR